MTARRTDGKRIQTRAVLAAAYLGPNKARGRMLSHAVEVDEEQHAIRVLCTRVVLESLADRYASDPDAEPTCAPCRRQWRAAKAR